MIKKLLIVNSCVKKETVKVNNIVKRAVRGDLTMELSMPRMGRVFYAGLRFFFVVMTYKRHA
jgi:hypothetical protein